jgi:hypothetical protein
MWSVASIKRSVTVLDLDAIEFRHPSVVAARIRQRRLAWAGRRDEGFLRRRAPLMRTAPGKLGGRIEGVMQSMCAARRSSRRASNLAQAPALP